MRRHAIAVGLLACAVATTTQIGSTAGSALPSETTAVYRSATVIGAQTVSIRHTVTAGTITAVTARLRKTGLLTTTVTARFGSDTAVVCTAGIITVLNALTGLGEADYTCTGFLENSARPRPLTIRAS